MTGIRPKAAMALEALVDVAVEGVEVAMERFASVKREDPDQRFVINV